MSDFNTSMAKLGNISPLIPAGEDVAIAIAFYTEKLGFRVTHQEGDPIRMAIVERDTAQIFLVHNDWQALAEQTALRIRVENIDRLYAEYQAQDGVIHPNGALQVKPWGPKEFGVLDPAGVCLTFYEFPPDE